MIGRGVDQNATDYHENTSQDKGVTELAEESAGKARAQQKTKSCEREQAGCCPRLTSRVFDQLRRQHR
jgi:HrpA-like RNA helicase